MMNLDMNNVLQIVILLCLICWCVSKYKKYCKQQEHLTNRVKMTDSLRAHPIPIYPKSYFQMNNTDREHLHGVYNKQNL
jgi:hypothetical protein